MKTRDALAAVAISAAVGAAARGDVVISDFEGGTATGWGWLTGDQRGIIPWPGPANGTVITAPAGPLAGSSVLRMTGDAAWNYGQGAGAVVGFDLVPPGFRDAFLAHDQIEFDWYAPPDPNSTSGWSQVYNIVLNTEQTQGHSGNGWQTVGGFGSGDQNANQYYYAGFGGALHHIVVDYSAYKAAVLADPNFPNGGGWIQLGMQLNAGGGAPAEMWFDNFKLSVAPNLWTADADGAWSTDSNWSKGAHPNGAGKVATFGPAINAPRTVTVDAAKTVGQINFNNANKYTIAGGATLTLDSTSAVGITATAGSHDITAPLALAQDANIVVGAADGTLTLNNLQASAVGITKSGAGALAVNNVRANSLNVTAGQVTVLAGGGAAGVSRVGALSIGTSAKLDLKDNKLITTTPVGTATTPSGNGRLYDGLQGMVQRAKNGDAWDGNGLTSSIAATEGGLTTIGIATGAQAKGGIGATETAVWGGQTITGSDILAMYTYAGDANLDGAITGDDYSAIDFGILFEGMDGYANGDFNYDGFVTGDDYSVIDLNILLQGPQIPTGGSASASALPGVTAVPEPSACSFALLAAAGAVTRRWRRRA